jgi:chaperone required for assembly of F1-ATPase
MFAAAIVTSDENRVDGRSARAPVRTALGVDVVDDRVGSELVEREWEGLDKIVISGETGREVEVEVEVGVGVRI